MAIWGARICCISSLNPKPRYVSRPFAEDALYPFQVLNIHILCVLRAFKPINPRLAYLVNQVCPVFNEVAG
jgi:hypothetical protein